jgi:hypothetical protein
MLKILIAFVAGFMMATVGLTGIVGMVDSKVSEVKEIITQ